MELEKLLTTFASSVGKPLADANSQAATAARAAYVKLRAGEEPILVLRELSSLMPDGPEVTAVLELIAALRPPVKTRKRGGWRTHKTEFIPPVYTPYTPPEPPKLLCICCNEPVYFYELQDPPMCLWCEKISDELNGEQYA